MAERPIIQGVAMTPITFRSAPCGHEIAQQVALCNSGVDCTIAWYCRRCRTIEMVERWDSPYWRTRALEIAQWAEERNDE